MKRLIIRWLLVILLAAGLLAAHHFDLISYLSFSSLKANHEALQEWTSSHYLQSVLGYILVYCLTVAFSIPGAVFVSLAGGLMFGPVATIYVVIGATMGATIVFLAVKTAIGEWFARRVSGRLARMEKGFNEHAFNYLLFLRLLPIFPFWLINIGAGLLAVPLRTFVIATFIGIIPGAFVYVMVGNSLHTVFATNQAPNLSIIFKPTILLPLVGLAFLSLMPILYQKYKGKRK